MVNSHKTDSLRYPTHPTNHNDCVMRRSLYQDFLHADYSHPFCISTALCIWQHYLSSELYLSETILSLRHPVSDSVFRTFSTSEKKSPSDNSRPKPVIPNRTFSVSLLTHQRTSSKTTRLSCSENKRKQSRTFHTLKRFFRTFSDRFSQAQQSLMQELPITVIKDFSIHRP